MKASQDVRKQAEVRRICPRDEEWPPELDELGPHGSPDCLYGEGLPLQTGSKTIAIIGTRRPTVAGLETAEQFAKSLAEAGFGIVSGMALGIDTAAHRAALRVGGYTIAVLGSGLDVDYPSRNKNLKRQIANQGTLITEYPLGTQPHQWNFPARNRIIAGLAAGVLVIEGNERSGALITARIAIDANRSVWAVPGSVRNPVASGPNELIRTGQAALVTEVGHILDELAPSLIWNDQPDSRSKIAAPIEEDDRAILALLDDAPVNPDRLCALSGLDQGKVSLALSRLEVRGFARKRFGGYEISDAGSRVREALAS
ncbi:MAG: DNA-processing protein DprA [Actinomycetota bacterium]|nr:DNA-processing protein DprA [Actinomycetota bacterium]